MLATLNQSATDLGILKRQHALVERSRFRYLWRRRAANSGIDMSRWSEQFDGNEIHQTLKRLADWLSVDAKEIDADHLAERRRIKKFLNLTSDVVGGLDPELYPDQQLLKLNQHLSQSQLMSSLQTYSSDPNVQLLRDANDNLTSIIPVISQLAALSRQSKARDVIKAVEEAYDGFVATIEERDKWFAQRLEENHINLQELDQEDAVLKNSHSLLEQQTKSALDSWKSEYSISQSERAESFSKDQINRGTLFDEALREWRGKSETEVKDISQKHTDKLEVAFKEYISEAEELRGDMRSKHQAILEIHELVGTDGVAGGYQKGANDELSAANLWRWISIASLRLIPFSPVAPHVDATKNLALVA